jgi:hypothetical protein
MRAGALRRCRLITSPAAPLPGFFVGRGRGALLDSEAAW